MNGIERELSARVQLIRAGHRALHACATFSIVARDPATRELGSACASRVVAVGARVPCFRHGVGVVNTQHHDDLRLAHAVLGRIAAGLDPQDALAAALEDDARPRDRQLIAIDVQARSAAWTGANCGTPCGHVIGQHCVAAGNTLAAEAVVQQMVSAYEESPSGPLALRLLRALEAGEAAGGDRRGKQSAALKVIPEKLSDQRVPKMDLRVDDHPEPVAELRRLYELLAR